MSFASRLRQAREQAGFTQQDLAKKLGVTKNAISNYERCKQSKVGNSGGNF